MKKFFYFKNKPYISSIKITKTMQTVKTTFNIKAGKNQIELTIEMDKYQVNVYYNGGSCACSGYYNYNKTEVIVDRLQPKFELFEEIFEEQLNKFARKNKFIKKA